MHKIEQLSTMSCSTNQRNEIRKKTERLSRTRLGGGAGDEDGGGGVDGFEDQLDPDTGRLINETRALPEQPTSEEIATTRLEEFLKTHTPRRDYDQRLPITRERKKILATIEESRFSIIQGGTGCGKTTQV
jgi:HrpA-like RNA helicase